MTERKAFKRRVRAQVATTGQSYAQAAAQLEAGNPARVAETHPASAVVVALLRASRLSLDPVTAFGIGGGIGFMYGLFRYADAPHPLLTLVCQHHPEPWAPAILDRLGVEYASSSGRRDVVRLLEDGAAMILPVARGVVPWLDADDLTKREEHIVLALPERESARVFDGTGKHSRLTKAEIVDAYAHTRRKHPVTTIRQNARLPRDLRPAVSAGLRATVSGMTDRVLGNSFDVNFGLSGLRRWSERVTEKGADGWRHVFAEDDAWRQRLIDCIDREHTAPTAGRPLFARMLRMHGLAGAAEHFDRSAPHWRAIALGATRGDLELESLGHHVDAIATEEADGIAALQDLLQGAAYGSC
ncbi:hypothetical protein [Microbacterium sp. CPCC 204701]|uniref:hypothetical protein n=1 Tax=Microbacterium sp. CPCC 204701 TaxID=2493084 RepID=UPI000FDA98DE|nr:hypothetical protein [Microbacterium sp. CPCC 204701]